MGKMKTIILISTSLGAREHKTIKGLDPQHRTQNAHLVSADVVKKPAAEGTKD